MIQDDFDLSLLLKPGRKKKINSRTKGHTFERKIVKILNDTFNTREFARTPGSGAFATSHDLPEHLKIYGDLITPLNFKFVLELKKGYNDQNISSIFNHNSDLWKFIKQVERDSFKSGKEWIILWQQDRQVILAITRKQVFPETKLSIMFGDYKISRFKDLLLLTTVEWFDE